MRNKIRSAEVTKLLPRLMEAARQREADLLALTRDLVELESPSRDKAGVDACMRLAADACQESGGRCHWYQQETFGNLLAARFDDVHPSRTTKQPGNTGQRPLLLLGHLDTVWPLGTLKSMPFRVEEDRVWGPGVLDMKAGVAMAVTALAILREMELLTRPVILLLNSEEEIGSPVSRPITEELARECEAVFVLEPAQGLSGAYKTARKGTGDFTVRVKGVAAHAGVDFIKGHSAVLELARQIERISHFTAFHRGLTVNPGVIGGGTQANVVAAEAWVHVDFRYLRTVDAKNLERKFRQLRPINKSCGVEVTGGINRPPMERTRGTARLFKQAATLAADMGFMLQEAATGGGSDGNFTSAIGIATLDGMGAVGEGAHASNESLLIEHLAPRTALLAAMMMNG